MQPAIIITLIFAAFMYFVYQDQNNRLERSSSIRTPATAGIVVLIVATVIKIFIAPHIEGYQNDMNSYASWMDRAAGGLNGFYAEGYFCDYPPLYIAMTGFFGWIKNLISPGLSPALTSMFQSMQIPITGEKYLTDFFIKMPGIVAEGLIGYEVLRWYSKHYPRNKHLPMAVLLALLPSFLITSTCWGQTDGIFCYFILLTFRFLLEDKLTLSATFFTISALLKPQSFLFAPLIAILFIRSDSLIFVPKLKDKFSKIPKIIWNTLVTFCFSLLLMSISVMPFCNGVPNLGFLVEKYKATFESYPHASLNIFNLFGVLGGNWAALTKPFLFLTCETWGTILMVASIIGGILAIIFNKDKKNLFLIFGTYLFAIVMLGTKMHERYWYTVPLLILLAYIFTGKKKYFGIFCVLNLNYYLNMDYALHALKSVQTDFHKMIFTVGGVVNIALLWYLIWETYTVIRADYPQKEKKVREYSQKFTWKSAVAVLCVMVIFGGAAFYRLGSTTNTPQTYAKVAKGQNVTFQFNETSELSEIRYFAGYGLRNFKIRHDGPDMGQYLFFDGKQEKSTYVFSWQQTKLGNPLVNSVTLEVLEEGSDDITEWGEFAFYNAQGNLIPYTVIAPEGIDTAAFSDEPQVIPEVPSYENSFYFDEIYHGRAAYEYKNDLPMYETTHPPLGKLLITIGINIFGMNPFGYRFMGVLFGILMIPMFYLLSKRLLKYNIVALLTTVLFSFGFMHLSHTRISSIDSFMVFFIMAAFAFLMEFVYEYVEKGVTKKSLLFLGISGVMFGCGAAVKWAAIYPGLGLGAIYLYAIWLRSKKATGKTEAGKLILWSVGLYAVIPFLIYYLTYIPYFGCFDQALTWKSFTSAQQHMFNYHSQLASPHAFSAAWYDWMVDAKPLWMHKGVTLPDGSNETIATMGNPIVLWAGLAAIIYLMVHCVKERKVSLPAFVILAGYFSQMLPWMFVTRCTFMYHYFPMICFLALGVGYYWTNNVVKKGKAIWVPIGICVLAVAMFAVFYPVLTGIPASPDYIEKLKITPNWIF